VHGNYGGAAWVLWPGACPALLAPGTPVIVATVGYAKGEQIWVKARVKEVI